MAGIEVTCPILEYGQARREPALRFGKKRY